MKRRNADCGKLRRPIKRNKITEGMYGSNTLLYMKFLVLWAIVITADFMLEFRFEFLWPFWLLLRSVHDSFKYKGLAFSVLFVCIAITSDLVCLFFIPVHWLFFAASTYVWVQYVWHTDKGICLPTIILWMLFVYLEAAIRWKDSRHMPHLDLCRPFAAHCIGYPVVTLGFGFKSYVGYRMRQRKQREVAKENEFYMQLLQQALPQDETTDNSNVCSSDGSTTANVSQQNDLQHKEITSVTAITSNNNNLNNNKNNAQNSSKSNSNLFNNSNGNVLMTSSLTSHISPSTNQMSNGINHVNSSSSTSSHKSNNHRRSLDKDSSMNSSNYLSSKLSSADTNSVNHHHHSASTSIDRTERTSSSTMNLSNSKANSKNTTNDNSTSSSSSSSTSSHQSLRDKETSSYSNHKKEQHDTRNGDFKLGGEYHQNNGHCNIGTSGNNHNESTSSMKSKHHHNHSHQNGSVLNFEMNETHENNLTETNEKHKSGRKNRLRQKNSELFSSSKDNHHNNQQQHQYSTSNTDSSTQLQSNNSSTTVTTSNTVNQISQHQQTSPQICESCLRLENEVKKMKQEINHLKQNENDLKQKIDSNLNYKNCLQVKQRENDELEKRIQEITNSRQLDRQNLQNSERRLGEERRLKQSLESQLNNERKQRKQVEDRASRSECGDMCKIKKQQLEHECNKLRRELAVTDDSKINAEQQNRNYEQELQKMKNELRNRDQQQGTEMLMSALTAMQLKNSTLEKNLSDETRVKLDLFSALGEAKRQLEIRDNIMRNREKEVHELKAKIAQLLAVMPACHPDSLCMGTPSSSGSSILRLNDTPPLLSQQSQQQQTQKSGGGPASPLSQLGLSVSPLLGQLSVLNSTPPPQQQQQKCQQQQHQQQQHQQSQSNSSTSSAGQVQMPSGSNLDPNATAYTPKTNASLVGGTEA